MLLLILYSLFVYQVKCSIDLTVDTTIGPVVGHRATEGKYSEFIGIPFAKVNESNPFGQSVAYPAFDSDNHFVANESVACAQIDANGISGVVDCLRLNVYVPDTANTTNPLPVYVWIFGGAFYVGSGILYGGKYLVQQDIVVVTVNYRLGPYGFLCLDDPTVPGNQGLKDQIEALRWVKNNIANFGGNPDDVTIGGESAGASSVDLHVYSNYETLFKKVIIESGSPFVEGMFGKADHNAAIKLTAQIGYNATNAADALDYLKAANSSDVLEAFAALAIELRPCQELYYDGVESFITDDPYHLTSDRVQNMSFLVGYNNREKIARYSVKDEAYFAAIPNHVADLIGVNYKINSTELAKVAHAAQVLYFASKNISKTNQIEFMDFEGDFLMVRSVEASANRFLRLGASKIYKYMFSYVGDISLYKSLEGVGASHLDELYYLFEMENKNLTTENDLLIRNRMVTMWANFVKYADPTPEVTDLLPVQWTPITSNTTIQTNKQTLQLYNISIDGVFGTVQSVAYPAFDSDNHFVANESVACAQIDANGISGVVDCLRLNVYVPDTANTTNPLPVYVWIFGGAFYVGSGILYGGKYLVQQDIVVVTVNYRLGPYGFLCLDDPTVPGNQGLKDQIEALRWVKNNIANFGGNPDDVTIGGESAGASSVDLHVYSNYETLFKKVIIESGSPFVEGMFGKADHNAAIKLTAQIGYNVDVNTNAADALDYLKAANSSDVLEAFAALAIELRPCQELYYDGVESFITDDPYHLTSDRVQNMSFLVGYNNREKFARYSVKDEAYFAAIPNHVADLIGVNYKINSTELAKVAHAAQVLYFASKNISKTNQIEFMDFEGDFLMVRSVEASANRFLRLGASKIYKYMFSYVGDISLYKSLEGVGASHLDELYYLFEMENKNLTTENDLLIRNRMVTMWANFVKYADPTPEVTDLLPVQWTPITSNTTKPYMNINVTMELGDRVYRERLAFWELFEDSYFQYNQLITQPISNVTIF